MSEELKSVQAKLEAALAKNTDLEKQLRDIDAKQLQAKLEKAEASLKVSSDELAKTLKLSEEQKTADKVALEMLAAGKAESETKLTAATTKLTEVEAKLAEIETAKAREARVTLVIEKLKVERAKAETFVDNLSVLNTEAFEKQVTSMMDLVAMKPQEVKISPVPGVGGGTKAAADAATAALETAEAKVDETPANVPVSDEANGLAQAVAAYFGCDEE